MTRQVLMACFVLWVAGWAAPTDAVGVDEPEPWSVAGKVVLRMRATVGDLTPLERVEILDERLTDILSKAERAIGVADIEILSRNNTVSITVCGDLLVTVLQQEADANGMSREKLAQLWLSNIRKTVPQLSPRVNLGGA